MSDAIAYARKSRPLTVSILSALAGALALIAGVAVAPQTIAISYLVAFTATLAVVIGMLLLVMIAHLSGATWFVLLRRQAEAVVGSLPGLAILTLPLLLALRTFWPWAAPFETLPESLQTAVRPKLAYFHPAFFIARAVGYWLVWLAAGELLRRTSRRQDAGTDASASDRLRILSAAGIPLVALAMTFAAFDWMMSLSPAWSSSVFGVYYFAGAMVSALALLAVLAWIRLLRGSEWSLTAEHRHALAKLTLAFVLFWGYVWYSQFFIIWIADIPREAAWYIVRLRGGWGVVGLLVLAGGFAVPVLVLLFRAAKRSATVLTTMGIWLLVVHYFDVYWLLVPAIRTEWSFAYLLWDLGAVAFIVGTATAVAIWRQAEVPPVPIGDPLLGWSIRYEAQ